MENILQHQENCSNKQLRRCMIFPSKAHQFSVLIKAQSYPLFAITKHVLQVEMVFFLEYVLQTLRLKHEGWGLFRDSVLLKLPDSLLLLAVSDGVADLWGFTLNPKLFNWTYMTQIAEAICIFSFCFFLSKTLSKSLDHIQTYQEYSWYICIYSWYIC